MSEYTKKSVRKSTFLKHLVLLLIIQMALILGASCNPQDKQRKFSISKREINSQTESKIANKDLIKIQKIFGRFPLNWGLERPKGYKELEKYPIEKVCHAAKKFIVANSDYRTILVLYYLSIKTQSAKFLEFLPIALSSQSALVRATILILVDEFIINNHITLNAKQKEIIKPFLNDENIVVRICAALNLVNTAPFEQVIKIAIEGFTSNEVFPIGDPAFPIVGASYQILTRIKPKEALINFIRQNEFEDIRIKYHLIDVYAYLTGKSSEFIYLYPGRPEREEMKILGKYLKQLEKDGKSTNDKK